MHTAEKKPRSTRYVDVLIPALWIFLMFLNSIMSILSSFVMRVSDSGISNPSPIEWAVICASKWDVPL